LQRREVKKSPTVSDQRKPRTSKRKSWTLARLGAKAATCPSLVGVTPTETGTPSAACFGWSLPRAAGSRVTSWCAAVEQARLSEAFGHDARVRILQHPPILQIKLAGVAEFRVRAADVLGELRSAPRSSRPSTGRDRRLRHRVPSSRVGGTRLRRPNVLSLCHMEPRRTLERISTVDALSRALRRRILDGELKPGERLREVDIAQAYGVGRYTVRAAFQDLVYRGMAESVPNRGVSVLEPTPEVIRDLYAYRAGLECEAARLIVEGERPINGPKAALAALAELPESASWGELLEADLAVHQAIVDAAGSPRISRAFTSIVDQMLLCLSKLSGPRAGVVADHRRLVRALQGNDADKAARTLREHLYDAVEQMGAAERPSPGARKRRAAKS
jgi:DNA-binding GntR family transcriptional regulator